MVILDTVVHGVDVALVSGSEKDGGLRIGFVEIGISQYGGLFAVGYRCGLDGALDGSGDGLLAVYGGGLLGELDGSKHETSKSIDISQMNGKEDKNSRHPTAMPEICRLARPLDAHESHRAHQVLDIGPKMQWFWGILRLSLGRARQRRTSILARRRRRERIARRRGSRGRTRPAREALQAQRGFQLFNLLFQPPHIASRHLPPGRGVDAYAVHLGLCTGSARRKVLIAFRLAGSASQTG